MWNSLRGIITGHSGEYLYLLSAGGVEWSLQVSASTLSDLLSQTQEVRVFTYLQHKEDQMSLFGFSEEVERTMFVSLLDVNGVGAKAALKILSAFRVERLQELLEQEDLEALSSVKGLGKKTAQKVLLSLKGKLVWDTSFQMRSPWFSDMVQALVQMGFETKKVEGVLAQLVGDTALGEEELKEREKQVFAQALLTLSEKR